MLAKHAFMLACLQAAAQAAYYLPSYDSRQVAVAISSLRQQIEAAKKAHLGKKKFGFSRKPKQTPAQQPSQQPAQLLTPVAQPQSGKPVSSASLQPVDKAAMASPLRCYMQAEPQICSVFTHPLT